MCMNKKHYYPVSLDDLNVGDVFFVKKGSGSFTPHLVVFMGSVIGYKHFLNNDITGRTVGEATPLFKLSDTFRGKIDLQEVTLYKPNDYIISLNNQARDIFNKVIDYSDSFERKMVAFKFEVDKDSMPAKDYATLVQVCRLLQWHSNLCTTVKSYGFSVNEDALAMASALLKDSKYEVIKKVESKNSLLKRILNKIFK